MSIEIRLGKSVLCFRTVNGRQFYSGPDGQRDEYISLADRSHLSRVIPITISGDASEAQRDAAVAQTVIDLICEMLQVTEEQFHENVAAREELRLAGLKLKPGSGIFGVPMAELTPPPSESHSTT